LTHSFEPRATDHDEQKAAWLAARGSQSPLGLYVHIPFCLKKCHYCDFVITTKRAPADRARFLAVLEAEIHHAREKYGRLKFSTFYLGGGTPSALEPVEFEAVYAMIHKNFDFEEGYEFSVEVNPGDVSVNKIKAYQAAGVNRVSLGVQAFQEHLLQDMNRPHGAHEIEQTVCLLREAGLSNISMDIILNLPGQSVSDVEETLRRILLLGANQVSVYDLDVHDKTAYGLRRREGRLKLSSEEDHARMAETVTRTLESAGLMHYELTNYARPGWESRHNLIYWRNQPYLGLGPGAFSYLNQVRYQFADSVESYLKKVGEKDWTHIAEDCLTPEEIEKETLLTGIRLHEGIDLRRLNLLRNKVEQVVTLWVQEGMLEKDGFRLKFTPQGKPVAEIMLRKLAQI